MRFNDGRCDRQGRFFAEIMLMYMAVSASVGCVYSYQKESGLTKLIDGFIMHNGISFSPDSRTMYLLDSHSSLQMVWAFDYDLESGTPSNRRSFIDMSPLPGRPDRTAIDADGCYRISSNDDHDADAAGRIFQPGKKLAGPRLSARPISGCTEFTPDLIAVTASAVCASAVFRS